MHVKFSFGIFGQNVLRIKQFVLAGLATTKMWQVGLATLSKAAPYSLNIFPLIYNKSFLSMPAFLGNPPMNIPISRSTNVSSGLNEYVTDFTNG